MDATLPIPPAPDTGDSAATRANGGNRNTTFIWPAPDRRSGHCNLAGHGPGPEGTQRSGTTGARSLSR